MADIARLPGPGMTTTNGKLHAACRGMDSSTFFHPPDERNQARADRITAAKTICAQCPATSACRDHALSVREAYGIWGGLSEGERAQRLGLQSLRYPAQVTSG